MDTMTFGEWLREELFERDMTKAELARAAGISAPHITRIIAGEQNPGNEVIVAIARALNKPPEEVFRRVVGLPLPEESSGLGEWVQFYYLASPQQREEMIDFARFILRKKPRRPEENG